MSYGGLESDETKLRHMIQYFVFGLKGSILGFQQGLLDDERIRLPDECFSSVETNANLMFISKFVAREKKIWDAYKFTDLSANMLMHEMENCKWVSTVSLLQEFCHSHDYQENNDDDEGWTPNPVYTRDEFSADWDAEKKTRC